MRRLCFTLFCFLLFTGSATAQEPLSFSKVIPAEGMNKNDLFVAMNEWFTEKYNSSNAVIQMSDKEAGIIIGKGATNYVDPRRSFACYSGIIRHTIKVQVKDGRFKVDLSNFVHEDSRRDAPCRLGLLTTAEVYQKNGSFAKMINTTWTLVRKEAYGFALATLAELEIWSTREATKGKDDW